MDESSDPGPLRQRRFSANPSDNSQKQRLDNALQADYFLGIDGGGTGCRARLADGQGRVLGEAQAGPANLGLGLEIALAAVMQATRGALAQAELNDSVLPRTRAGLGLAAANVPALRAVFEGLTLPFASAVLRSDAETACLGAHGGEDGAILILGTGSQGVLVQDGQFTTVGGWGLALSDWGSGALIGRAAIRRAFQALEGLAPASNFTQVVLQRFAADRSAMLDWAANARPREWAELAPLVFEHAALRDEVALALVQTSAADAARLLDRLIALGARRIALMGGVAAAIKSYLPARVLPWLVPPIGDAMDGALLLAMAGAGALAAPAGGHLPNTSA